MDDEEPKHQMERKLTYKVRTIESQMSCNTILLVSFIINQSCWKACISASKCHHHTKNMIIPLS